MIASPSCLNSESRLPAPVATVRPSRCLRGHGGTGTGSCRVPDAPSAAGKAPSGYRWRRMTDRCQDQASGPAIEVAVN